ncbi:MAG: MopE-related protein [Polyangiaceae bacterium]
MVSIARPLSGSVVFAALSAAWVFSAATEARAATGICDSNPPTTTQACIDAIQANGNVVNDVFHDANGLGATQLPVYGQLFNAWPSCTATSFAGCAGVDTAPADCPGQYSCTAGVANTFANASAYLNGIDHQWWHPCRIPDSTLVGGCPQFGSCITDGVGGQYNPWEGLVFDLGGPANKVAIFATNDHGPQPCESVEYTVFLSDNPFATEVVLHPTTDGIDPNKWNRAVLKQLFTKGWVEVRPPDPVGHAACGDTSLYSVEQDSFVPIYALPCGVTFRYAAIVAGNDGLDFTECAFDSNEGEIDAVAGLTESGAAVCNDADGDLYVDCNCVGAPAVCDCNDADPGIHPGAPESCDDGDLNCDGAIGACDAGLFCNEGICVPPCTSGEFACPAGSSCQTTSQGDLCVPNDCTVGGCPPGSVCTPAGVCVPACDGVVCPGSQVCIDGQCKDPCADVVCPDGKECQGGKCVAPCSCYAANIGCSADPGKVCDATSGECVDPSCVGQTCDPTETCDPTTGMCVGFCGPNVVCPLGQKCVDPDGCVPACTNVTCDFGFACDPATGECVDKCKDVVCLDPLVCVDGQCVPGQGGAGGTGEGGANQGGSSAGGSANGGTGNGGSGGSDDDGCNCSVPGEAQGGRAATLVGLLGLALLAKRRRSRAR